MESYMPGQSVISKEMNLLFTRASATGLHLKLKIH